jgi:hypothetical protein
MHQLIMAATIVIWPPWGHTSGAKAYNNQKSFYATGLSIVKTRKKDLLLLI